MFQVFNSNFDVMQQIPRFLGMQIKFSLTFANMFFNIESILCHYEVKFDLITSLIAAILQSKWLLEEEMRLVEDLWQIDDAKFSLLSSIKDRNFIF